MTTELSCENPTNQSRVGLQLRFLHSSFGSCGTDWSREVTHTVDTD